MNPLDAALDALAPGLRSAARERLGEAAAADFTRRASTALPEARRALTDVYGVAAEPLLVTLLGDVLERAADRDDALRASDRQREQEPGWFQSPAMVGYVCYADRFAAGLQGVRERLAYLQELGVTYLHLMPVLAPREGESDGGYAVADYDAVDPRLGTMSELSGLADDLHGRGMSLCIDLVLNHTAREHEWARRARAGEVRYQDFYLVYPDRTLPDAFERTVPDIFPELAPGTFTFVPELAGWVWTTFREFQWDLNYANPNVFRAMLDTMLRLANRGADVLRLDAAPFLWKRLGTNCQDQPETHALLQAFRALTRVAAPGLLLKAEAMVAPEILGGYLGDHGEYRPECDLAYDNQLMVMLWSTLATGDTRLAAQALTRRRPAPSATSWATYVRCHDDIGWAVSDADAAAVGLDGPAHRRFLSAYYAGTVAGSLAAGVPFQQNSLGEAPISGMAASLCGLDAALAGDDPATVEAALRRLETLYSVAFSFGGLPLVYMGDELALRNDAGWDEDPAHRGDNRWLHRPVMDWDAAARREDAGTVEARMFAAMRALARCRRRLPALRSNATCTVLPSDRGVLAYRRNGDGQKFVAVANFTDEPRSPDTGVLSAAGLSVPHVAHATTANTYEGAVVPWGFVWLVQSAG